MKAKHGITNDFIEEFRLFKSKEIYRYIYYLSYPAYPNGKKIFLTSRNTQKKLYRFGELTENCELIITKKQYLINKK